jgi:hypothetical protein
MMKSVTLSKSSFASGLQCHKRLWIEKNDRGLVPVPSQSKQATFDQGHEIGSWSHKLFPDGILLSGELDFKAHLKASSEALNLRKPLFEPAFAIPGAYARADIFVPAESNGWNLLEVKSSSNVWEDAARTKINAVYLQDIAFQVYVYRKAGIDVREAYLVFLNRDYIRQGDIDPQQLFRREKVTSLVEALLPSIPAQLAALSEMLQSPTTPGTEIGPHCFAPYECSLTANCWKGVPDDSVFTLAHAGAKAWTWWNEGIIRVADLPPSEKYSANQSIQIAVEKTQETHLDASAVRRFLEGLRYPLHFLDFETVMPAVPMFDGCRPYAQVPFQFSLHLQIYPGGELTHVDYLADGAGDPRPGFLRALQASLGTEGSIVSYNSPFETSRMRELAAQFSDHAAWINLALIRFENADLLQPFRSFALYHPAQHGSASIKSVLPAFTDLSYDDLAIQEGGTASNLFLRLLKGLVPQEEHSNLRENLRRYCERDTFAMVKLVEKLSAVANQKASAENSPIATTEPITSAQIDELLRFLPLFSHPNEELEPQWHGIGSAPEKDGSLQMPYPTYPPIVKDFFGVAGQPCWSDRGYLPEVAAKMIQSDEAIASASLSEIRTMLTFCVRGERFCDGHWGAMIRQGRIAAILNRLVQLRESV